MRRISFPDNLGREILRDNHSDHERRGIDQIAIPFRLDLDPRVLALRANKDSVHGPASDLGPNTRIGRCLEFLPDFLRHGAKGNDGDAGRLIESWFILFIGNVRPGKLHNDIANPLIFWHPDDPVRRFVPGRGQPRRKRAFPIQSSGDLRASGADLIDRASPGAFDQTGQILLVQREGIVARLAGWHDRQVFWIGFIQKHARRCVVTGFLGAAAENAPTLVAIIAIVG